MQQQGQAHGVNPVWLAQSRLRRRKFDSCIELCTGILEKNPYDQAVWYLKTRALTLKNWIDDLEIEEEGVADVLMDEHQVAQVPRPGTSLSRPLTSASGSGAPSQAVRPMTGSGRPLTGFARPGTSSRPTTSASGRAGTASLQQALRTAKPGTARPVTTSGRFIRLGTASLASEPGGPFINVDRLDLRKYAARPLLARVLCDYLIYTEHNMKRALELCALATQVAEYQDWWWKARLGKCYYQLGLLRDAERQFKSALGQGQSAELCKIYLRMDQPNTALEHYTSALGAHPGDSSLLLGVARVYDALGDAEKAVSFYKNVLFHDASNVEAIACLAAHHFYTDQPEIALRYYRRLLQMGVTNAELWNNLGLCCFYASQYDMCLGCFDRALSLADDNTLPDVWYNIGQTAVGIGDLALAYQAFKIAISLNPNHAEAFNNLGVLEYRKGNDDSAAALFRSGQREGGHVFEVFFNGALLAFKAGDFQVSFELVNQALQAYPEHTESHELLKQLKAHFTML
ncbi:TRP protein for flagellar function [Volvox carteri f. nagariensis]|uniref:TRP protein for flagellar function n=1 Tax=Volvox carteri f. nagariensis TaxID=3068 RepID=D8UKY7_VOLCA|nr:TRP protein for flagellar function [Volvox carteri f. nagariensis]EFJ39613.1 TRP protein for flagellar function [Volvox carteri f. nagariensis]|eukprot:XP_002959320.1 TRP protein for flagellar function [Volvox carteri f. nagariensis]